MTAYEWFDFGQSAFGNSVACQGILLTIMFSYLVAAYMIGARLSKSQLLLINCLFILSSGWMTFSMIGFLVSGINSSLIARELSAESSGILLGRAFMPLLAGGLHVLFMLGCLKFMWDIRHPNSD